MNMTALSKLLFSEFANMNSTNFACQKIFQTGLSVETISLYLLCRGLHDAKTTISKKNLLKIWNGSEAGLAQSLGILCEKNILKKILSDLKSEEKTVYILTADINKWNI